jgi:hypothetical protein
VFLSSPFPIFLRVTRDWPQGTAASVRPLARSLPFLSNWKSLKSRVQYLLALDSDCLFFYSETPFLCVGVTLSCLGCTWDALSSRTSHFFDIHILHTFALDFPSGEFWSPVCLASFDLSLFRALASGPASYCDSETSDPRSAILPSELPPLMDIAI